MADNRFDRMNTMILTTQLVAWGSLLWLIENTSYWVLILLELYVFCLMMQGVFSMMHEGFHDHAHRSPTINKFMTWLSSTLFGASATFIRVNHIGHHYRNRTDAELVDFVYPHESRTRKTIAYYLGIFGGIWLGASFGSLLICVLPDRWLKAIQKSSESNTYAAAIGDLESSHFSAIKLEVVASLAFLVAASLLLSLSFGTLALAYGAFAVSWSSLQWIYHVRTPIDVVEGTYNLRVTPLVRLPLLNFNYNLTHHRDPD